MSIGWPVYLRLSGIVFCALLMGCEGVFNNALTVSTRTKKKKSEKSNPQPEQGTPATTLQIEPSESTPESTVELSAIQGNVTSTTDGVNSSQLVLELYGSGFGGGYYGLSGPSYGLSSDPTNCAAGTYTVEKIGGGSSATLKENQPFSNSQFTFAIPANDEVAITFSCADGNTIRCLAQPGDAGILCNAIADSILTAFEAALGKSITHTDFSGKRVSKISAAIVDASKLATDEVDIFKEAIDTCKAISDDATKKSCYQDAIAASPFNASFKVMQQMVGNWTVEGVVMLVTDVFGMDLMVDSFLYAELMDAFDEAMGMSFASDLRTLLANVVTAQQAGNSSYAFRVDCTLEIDGTKKRIATGLNGSDQVICDTTKATQVMQDYGVGAGDISGILAGTVEEEVSCNDPDDSMCWINLAYTVSAVSKEPNRNDVGGQKREERTLREIGLVEPMPQVLNALDDAGFDTSGGPPPYDPDSSDPNVQEDNETILQVLGDTKQYFLGLLGIYRMLNDSNLKNLKLSLQDMHDIFVHKDIMRMRMVSWGPGYNGVEVGQRYIPPMLTYNSSLGGFQQNSEFAWSDIESPPSLTDAEVATIFNNSSIPYQYTFKQFESIPNSREIENFVFNASHHEEWNPMGQKYLYVAQYKTTSNPIACKLTNYGSNFQLTSSTTVTCDTSYTGVSCDSAGACTFPSDYEYPFLLVERGWYGDDKGRLYALVSRKTGMEIGRGIGRGVMIKEYKAGNAAGKCDNTQTGSVISYIEEFWCGPEQKCEEDMTAYCMDMSALAAPSRKRFYFGGHYTVQSFDESSGESWEWQVPLVASYDGSNHDNDWAACLFVPDGSLVTNTGDSLADTNVTAGIVDDLTGITNAAVKSCDVEAAGGESKYRLFQWQDFASADTMYAYLLDSNNMVLQHKREPGVGENWEDTYLQITKSNIESKLTGRTVAGSATTQINGRKFLNPRHKAKFDPYCDDVNLNGSCDCYPVDSISADRKTITYASYLRDDPDQCGLSDKAAEPTISELPYCPHCGSETTKAEDFFETYGGKSGSDLSTMDNYITTNNVFIDFHRVFVCKYRFNGETNYRQPRWLDWGNWDGNHEGCPASEGDAYDASAMGQIRLMNIKPMRNAYDVPRPNAMVKLINYATKTVGQGRSIDKNAKVFSLDEVLAMVALRLMLLPDNVTIYDPSGNPADEFMTSYEGVEKLNDRSRPFSGVLKGIMYKAGLISAADLAVTGGS